MIVLRPLGVRRSVVAIATTVLGVSLALAGVLLRVQLRQSLERSIVEQTVIRAEAVAEIASAGDLPTVIEASDRIPGWVQVVGSNNEVLAATPNLATKLEPIAPLGSPVSATVVRMLHGLVVDPDDRMAVVYSPTLVNGRNATVIVAAPLDLADATEHRATTAFLIAFPALVTISGAVIWLAARRALRPVEAIRSQVAAITATTDLARRVPVPPSRDEIARLATTMNDTLDRLEASSARQRRFVADASHELRSPLASLRNQLEAATIGSTDAGWLAGVADLRVDVDRLERLVGDLLVLAHHDEGERRTIEPLDLGHLVRTEMRRRPTPAGIERRVTAENALVEGSEADLVRIVRNLLDNAERHARSVVDVVVVRHGDQVELRVFNDGTRVPPSELTRIFERFHRLDEARSSDAGGSGLGLAIVSELVRAHNGSVVAEPIESGASFIVRLPRLSS